MFKKICVIANGELKNKTIAKKILKNSDLIIAADGGANHLKDLKIFPDYIIGDMDSIKKSVLNLFNKSYKTVTIKDVNQNYTDTELAIKLANIFKPKKIILLAAIGDRIDHSLANILTITRQKNIKIFDGKNEMAVLKDSSLEIRGRVNDTISIIPLTDTKNITYKNLRWNVKKLNTGLGWIGICNKLTKTKATISVKKGTLIVIKIWQ